jgi:hypothetical protein
LEVSQAALISFLSLVLGFVFMLFAISQFKTLAGVMQHCVAL